jgi:hypothetical protein
MEKIVWGKPRPLYESEAPPTPVELRLRATNRLPVSLSGNFQLGSTRSNKRPGTFGKLNLLVHRQTEPEKN